MCFHDGGECTEQTRGRTENVHDSSEKGRQVDNIRNHLKCLKCPHRFVGVFFIVIRSGFSRQLFGLESIMLYNRFSVFHLHINNQNTSITTIKLQVCAGFVPNDTQFAAQSKPRGQSPPARLEYVPLPLSRYSARFSPSSHLLGQKNPPIRSRRVTCCQWGQNLGLGLVLEPEPVICSPVCLRSAGGPS